MNKVEYEQPLKKNRELNEKSSKLNESKVLIENADFSELSTQQKIWIITKVIINAAKPFILYMFVPAIVIAVGCFFYKGTIFGVNETYLESASNFYTFLGIIVVLITMSRIAKKNGTTVSEEVSLFTNDLNIKYLLGMFLFGFTLSFSISSVLTLLPDFLMSHYDSLSGGIFTGYDMILILVSLAVLDPIAEEIVFRGYMLNRLLPFFKERKSVLIVSITFALCHLDIVWALYGFILGIILAKVSIRHDNIMYSIAIHMGFNFVTVVCYLISTNSKLNDFLFGNKLIIFMYLIIFSLISYVFYRIYLKNENIDFEIGSNFFSKK